MKIKNSHKEIAQLGGAVVLHKKMYDHGLDSLIEKCFGPRVKQAKYSYQEVIIAWMLTLFCNGFRLTKIGNVEKDLSVLPLMDFCSHDTLGRVLKSLATENEVVKYTNPKNRKDGEKTYVINENEQTGDLLIMSAKKMGLLKTNKVYTVDIDATPIESEVRDAVTTYKRHKGFMPMVCTIGNVCVFISLRSGNANPHYRKLDCLKKCIELLRKHNIKVGRVRIDGAGYKNEVMEYLDSENIEFVIGANYSPEAQRGSLASANWTKRRLETSKHVWDAEFCSFDYKLQKGNKEFRMATIRVKREDRPGAIDLEDTPTKWKLKDGYYYKFVITNDKKKSTHDLFKEYHERGAFERCFDSLKNSYGWRTVPFSKLNENLVYMTLTAMASNIYDALLAKLAKKVKQLSKTFRLEKFREIFIRSSAYMERGVCRIDNKYNIDFEKIC